MDTTNQQQLQLIHIKDIDAKEFSLDDEKSLSISNSFQPKIIERDGLAEIYSQIIKKEITQDVCDEANELRKKLVKVRTGIADIHKTEKAFYLAAGKYCDALKNKLTLPGVQMEETLEEIASHFEKQEASKKELIKQDRIKILAEFEDVNPEFYDLANMEQEIFDKLVKDNKDLKEFRLMKEAEAEKLRKQQEEKDEAKRVELQKKEDKRIADAKTADEREKIALKLFNFIDEFNEIDWHPFGMTDDQFKKIISDAEKCSAEYAEREKIAQEENAKNLKAKQEAEAKAKAIEAESIQKQKKLHEEAEKQKKEASEREAALQKQIADKQLAEFKAKEDADKKIQDELNAGDKVKMQLMINDLTDLKTKRQFKSKKYVKLHSDICDLIDKITTFANSKM